MKKITIGSASIPLDDYAIGGTAILGIRSSGKTYTAKGIAEQLLDYGIPIVVFDAIGVWRWLKVAGDGPGARGYKVVVAGGEAGDLPLTTASAAEIVRAAIRENISVVIDLYSHKLSKADWARIVRTCFHVLLYENVGVRHIFLEECSEFVPQRIFDGETYAAVEKLVRMGGNKSLGITLINQRAQEVNKAVLDLCENLILLRQRGSHAIDSLEKWMDRLSPDQAKQIAKAMPSMAQGECWVFRSEHEDAIETKSNQIHSFHPDRKKPGNVSGRVTADTGEFIVRMKTDLTKLFEEQKENDPAVWKKRVAELERALKHKETTAPGLAPSAVEALSAAEQRGHAKGFNEAVGAHDRFATIVDGHAQLLAQNTNAKIDELKAVFTEKLQRMRDAVKDQRGIHSTRVIATEISARAHQARAGQVVESGLIPVTGNYTVKIGDKKSPTTSIRMESNGSATLPVGERNILSALIQYPNGLTRKQLTTITSYVKNTRNLYLQKLSSRGYVDTGGERMLATDAGRQALPDAEPLPTGEELQDFWKARLPLGEWRILEHLISIYPKGATRQAITDATNYVKNTRNLYLQKLRGKELIDGSSEIKASENLF